MTQHLHSQSHLIIVWNCREIKSKESVLSPRSRQITLFFDMEKCGLANMDLDFTQYLIGLLKDYYPYFLNYVIVFEMPWILSGEFYRSVSQFICLPPVIRFITVQAWTIYLFKLIAESCLWIFWYLTIHQWSWIVSKQGMIFFTIWLSSLFYIHLKNSFLNKFYEQHISIFDVSTWSY